MSAVANGSGDAGPKKKTIEGIYQKKSQLEHILLRPDSYIGSVEFVCELMWVYDAEKEMMVQREIKYVPGLYKIFDEILVNAADNKQRDDKMDCIKIDIDAYVLIDFYDRKVLHFFFIFLYKLGQTSQPILLKYSESLRHGHHPNGENKQIDITLLQRKQHDICVEQRQGHSRGYAQGGKDVCPDDDFWSLIDIIQLRR